MGIESVGALLSNLLVSVVFLRHSDFSILSLIHSGHPLALCGSLSCAVCDPLHGDNMLVCSRHGHQLSPCMVALAKERVGKDREAESASELPFVGEKTVPEFTWAAWRNWV